MADSARGLRIAMIGTRGVPASYGGFETAIEEIGSRLARRGHQVLVYSRTGGSDRLYRGMRVVPLPALGVKQLETLSHTGLSALHAVTRVPPDVAFVFNAANAPFLPLLRARGIPVALHMDGLEWRRSKWGRGGQAYYRWAEQSGLRAADAAISDAPGIADYYEHQFGLPTELLRYGAPLLTDTPVEPLATYGLEPAGYHLVVARFEPENHVLEIVRGYRRSAARLPLVVVGSAPYGAEYIAQVTAAAGGEDRIRLLGSVFDQHVLDALYAHARTYLHGHSVGGTNPSLLRAMGAATATIAYDVVFNRETLAGQGWFFRDADDVASAVTDAERRTDLVGHRSRAVRARAEAVFSWDAVTDGYADLATRLAAGESFHGEARRTRRRQQEWPGGS